MWTQQTVISILVFATTGLGFLGHISVSIASVIYPDSPFQTPVSLGFLALIHYLRPGTDPQPLDADPQSIDSEKSTASCIQWILETSINPDVIRPAVELMSTLFKQPDVIVTSWRELVGDKFKACFEGWDTVINRDSALAYGNTLVHFAWHYPEARRILCESMWEWYIWYSWRNIYLPWALERVVILHGRMRKNDGQDPRRRHEADIRTALRMAVATGINGFTEPDDETLVLDSRFQLPSYHRIDINRLTEALKWGMAYYSYVTEDVDVAGDALLLAGGLIELSPGHGRDILRIYHDITLRWNITHRRWHAVALRTALNFLDNFKELLDDEILLRVVLMVVLPPTDSIVENTGDQFTKVIHMLNFTEWPEGHHLHLFPLSEIQCLVLHSLRILPTLAVTVDITTRNEYIARWSDALTVEKSAEYTTSWRDTLIRMMGADNDPTIRRNALRAACKAVQDLDLITATRYAESQRGVVLSEFSRVLLAAADTNLPDYPNLICTLAKGSEWHQHLITDGHVDKCMTLTDHQIYVGGKEHLYAAGVFLHVAPPEQGTSCCSHITNEQRWILMKTAWNSTDGYYFRVHEDNTDIILNLVNGTEIYVPQDLSQDDLRSFSKRLSGILDWLESEEDATVISAVKGLKGMVDGTRLVDAIRI